MTVGKRLSLVGHHSTADISSARVMEANRGLELGSSFFWLEGTCFNMSHMLCESMKAACGEWDHYFDVPPLLSWNHFSGVPFFRHVSRPHSLLHALPMQSKWIQRHCRGNNNLFTDEATQDYLFHCRNIPFFWHWENSLRRLSTRQRIFCCV